MDQDNQNVPLRLVPPALANEQTVAQAPLASPSEFRPEDLRVQRRHSLVLNRVRRWLTGKGSQHRLHLVRPEDLGERPPLELLLVESSDPPQTHPSP